MHLHQRNIVHHDLAARNIVLTNDLVCKIANFGFAAEVATDIGERVFGVSKVTVTYLINNI